MTIHTYKCGDVPTGPTVKNRENYYENRQRTFQCHVCKSQCVITLTSFSRLVGPSFCPFEPDITNLRYAKWEEVKQ